MAASLLALSCGMALGWTSAASAVESGAQGFPLAAEEWSWVGAMLTVGAVPGCVAVGALLRPLGRRLVCLGLAPLLLCGWALHAWATAVSTEHTQPLPKDFIRNLHSVTF